MAEFKKTDFQIKGEEGLSQRKVANMDSDSVPVIRDFEFTQVSTKGKGDYKSIKAKYGPLAATDAERNA
ncbi:MAG: hypothetical protein HYX41_04555 [Bdellovibrio sp.]|nr:hypothetical protein [Bdellovibrio sp.]